MNENKEKSVLVRFNDEEWNFLEKTRLNYGVRTRGNLIRFLIIPKLKEAQSQ